MELNLNDELHGFRVTRIRPLEDRHGTLYEMEHEKTGAKLCWLARAEENKTFCIGFRTIPENDTGVFHICEHSVLNGSRKYPVREPFVDLLKSSLQTFLNAMTGADKTFYPVSSRNPRDFLNLMDVYLDAVLHPAIYTNPDIFRQEGWHYEIRNPEDEPVYKGVVFNEMKGAFSSVDETIIEEMNRILFPDNCYKYVSGGDPEHIPDLSYEDFLATHKRFYHPGNSMTFLDGDLDIDAVLGKIDGYFRDYDHSNGAPAIPMQKDVPACRKKNFYEIAPDEDPKNKTQITFGRVIGTYEDVKKLLAWDVLSSVLAEHNESPLKKAVLEAGAGQDVEIAVIDSMLQPYAAVIVRNTDEALAEKAEKVIKDTLSDLAEHGLDHEAILAALSQNEFHYREPKEPAGVMLAASSYNSWMYGGDPELYLNCGSCYQELRAETESGYFENLLKEFLDPDHLSLLITLPDPDLGKKRAEKEAARLHSVKESWGPEITKYIAENLELDEWQAGTDTPEQKASLPKLSLSEVSAKPIPLEPEEQEYHHVPILLYPESDSGIVYLNLYFSAAGLRKEQLPYAGMYSHLLSRLPTKSHTLPELQQEIRRYVGNLSFYADVYAAAGHPDACIPVLACSCSVLKENLPKAVDLILEILQETILDPAMIQPMVLQEKEQYRQTLIAGGHSAAILRAAAHFTADNAAKEYFSGITAAQKISELADHYDQLSAEFVNEAEMYQEVIFSRNRLTMSISGEENLPECRRIIDSLNDIPFQRCVVHYPLLTDPREGIEIPAQIGYSASVIRLPEYSGHARVLAHMMTYGYLWTEIRVKGGAYGTGFLVSPSGITGCWSYRDPTPGKSLSVYQNVPAAIREMAASSDDLTDYIIGTIASAEPLMTPGQKQRTGDSLWFRGQTYESRQVRRQEILSTVPEDLVQLADQIESAENRAEVLAAPKQMLEQEEGMTILRIED